MNIHVFIYMCSVSGPVAFSQSVYTVHESQARLNISIFSYIFVALFDDLMVNFTTFDENATKGTLSHTSYLVHDNISVRYMCGMT